MDLIEKLKDKLVDLIVDNLVKIIAFLSISLVSIIAYIEDVLFYKFEVSVFHCIIFGTILLIAFFVYKKLKSKQRFDEGTKVILSTYQSPVMSAGKYNCIKNKVKCTWSVEKTIKSESINQNLLIEYKPRSTERRKVENSIWN